MTMGRRRRRRILVAAVVFYAVATVVGRRRGYGKPMTPDEVIDKLAQGLDGSIGRRRGFYERGFNVVQRYGVTLCQQ